MRTTIGITVGTLAGLVLAATLHAAAGAASTSLVDAAKSGDANAVRTLLQQKSVDVNATAVDGSTALHWAVQRGDARMVESLIRAGALDSTGATRLGMLEALPMAMGQAARRRIEREFTWDIAARRFAALYESLVGEQYEAAEHPQPTTWERVVGETIRW